MYNNASFNIRLFVSTNSYYSNSYERRHLSTQTFSVDWIRQLIRSHILDNLIILTVIHNLTIYNVVLESKAMQCKFDKWDAIKETCSLR